MVPTNTHELIQQAQQRLNDLKHEEADAIRAECHALMDSVPDMAVEWLREAMTSSITHHKHYSAPKFVTAWEWGTFYRVLSTLVGHEIGCISPDEFEPDDD